MLDFHLNTYWTAFTPIQMTYILLNGRVLFVDNVYCYYFYDSRILSIIIYCYFFSQSAVSPTNFNEQYLCSFFWGNTHMWTNNLANIIFPILAHLCPTLKTFLLYFSCFNSVIRLITSLSTVNERSHNKKYSTTM